MAKFLFKMPKAKDAEERNRRANFSRKIKAALRDVPPSRFSEVYDGALGRVVREV
jgi:hypothetical protein